MQRRLDRPVITRHGLAHRIGLTAVQLGRYAELGPPPRGAAAKRLDQAQTDLVEVRSPELIGRAWKHLSDHAAGYPTDSMPGPSGKGGHSDRTGSLAVPEDGEDQVSEQTRQLDDRSVRLVRQTIDLFRTDALGALTEQIEEDAAQVRWIIKRWAQEPDVRYCSNCVKDNGYKRTIVRGGRHFTSGVCPWCGDYRKVNGALPPVDVLHYHHLDARRIPEAVLRKHRHRIPRGRR